MVLSKRPMKGSCDLRALSDELKWLSGILLKSRSCDLRALSDELKLAAAGELSISGCDLRALSDELKSARNFQKS